MTDKAETPVAAADQTPETAATEETSMTDDKNGAAEAQTRAAETRSQPKPPNPKRPTPRRSRPAPARPSGTASPPSTIWRAA